jgi:chromodomain-helicase-DNA-binding protein 1
MYKKILQNQAEEAQAKKIGNVTAAAGSSGASAAVIRN